MPSALDSYTIICIRSASVSYMLEHSKYLLYRSTHDSTEIIVNRSRKIERYLSQPFFVAEIFTRMQGAYVCLNETIRWFTLIISGSLDIWPEGKFYLKGSLA